MKETGNYTATEIERYHNGALPPAEMHSLEKAALDDPFLADALEGYSSALAPVAHLSMLQNKLQQRIDKGRKKNLFFIDSSWLRIAALFVVIAGGGWLIFGTLITSAPKEVAKNTTTQNGSNPLPRPTYRAADSTTTDSPALRTDETVAINKNAPTTSPEKQRSVMAPNSTQSQSGYQSNTEASKNDSALVMLAPSVQDKFKSKEQQDSISSLTALRDVTVNGNGRKTDTIKNVNVVLKNIEIPADEVVVVNKKNSNKMSRSQYMKMTVDTLEPENGWGNYDDYIASNLKTPDELKMKPVSGLVELSFDVNQKGEPVNVAVTKSLCDKCDEEAIRLLREGPKWKKRIKKGKLKIKFAHTP